MGTIIFRVGLKAQPPVFILNTTLYSVLVPLPGNGWEQSSAIKTDTQAKIEVSLPYTVEDVTREYETDARKLISTSMVRQLKSAPRGPLDAGNHTGFVHQAAFEFDFPFPVPVAYGLRYLEVKAPFDWDAAVRLAGSHEDKDVALANACGSAGWSCRYYRERVDDMCPVWASLGTGKDCEDMALTAASVLISLLNNTISGSTPRAIMLAEYARSRFLDAEVAFGWARIRGVLTPHAWAAFVKRDNPSPSRIFVEGTSQRSTLGPEIDDMDTGYLTASCVYRRHSAAILLDSDGRVGVSAKEYQTGATERLMPSPDPDTWSKFQALTIHPQASININEIPVSRRVQREDSISANYIYTDYPNNDSISVYPFANISKRFRDLTSS